MPIRWCGGRCFASRGRKVGAVLVFAKGEKEREALEAGADFAGADNTSTRSKGLMDLIRHRHTDMMTAVSKLGRILVRGMMPNAKLGTVTFDVPRPSKKSKRARLISKSKRRDRARAHGQGVLRRAKMLANISAFMETIMRLKPLQAKEPM